MLEITLDGTHVVKTKWHQSNLISFSLTCRLTGVLGSWMAVALLGKETGRRIWVPAWPVVVSRVWDWPDVVNKVWGWLSTCGTPPVWLIKNCCTLGAGGWGLVWSFGLLCDWGHNCGLLVTWGWIWVMSWPWDWSCSGLPQETVTSSILTTVGKEESAWVPGMELGSEAGEGGLLDAATLSIFRMLVLRTAETGLQGTGPSLGDTESVALFSTSSCILSASTNFCSCSNFLINSSICRSFSWSRLSFSSGTWEDVTGQDCWRIPPEFITWGKSEMPTSCWTLEGSAGMGETGGVEFRLSGATCWTGRTIAGVEVLQVMSMGTEMVVVVVVVGATGTEIALGAVLSWNGFSLSIRSVFVPDTGRPRNFSSSFSSATYARKLDWQDWLLLHEPIFMIVFIF